MDGTGLVNYSGPLPFEESALQQSGARTNSHGQSLTLIAAGIVVVIALVLYFNNVAKLNRNRNRLGLDSVIFGPPRGATLCKCRHEYVRRITKC